MNVRIVGFGLIAVLLAGNAVADPVLISVTGDGLIWWDSSSGSFDLSGNGLQIQSGGTAGVSGGMVQGFAGDTVSLSGFIGQNFLWQGFAQINGTAYSIPGSPSGAVWRDSLAFSAIPVVLPTVPDGLVSVSASMTMHGTVAAFESFNVGAPELFSFDVTGSGTATALLNSTTLPDGTHHLIQNSGGTGYGFEGVATLAPTPEPSTCLLLATAAGFVAAVRRRWRSAE